MFFSLAQGTRQQGPPHLRYLSLRTSLRFLTYLAVKPSSESTDSARGTPQERASPKKCGRCPTAEPSPSTSDEVWFPDASGEGKPVLLPIKKELKIIGNSFRHGW